MYGVQPPYQPPRPSGGSSQTVILAIAAGAFLVGGALVVGSGVYLLRLSKSEATSDAPLPASTLTSASASVPSGTEPAGPAPTIAVAPVAAATAIAIASDAPAAAPAPKTPAPATARTKWFCNATGWARVCGFANVCSNQMVSGIGSGTDQYSAKTMAKNACENMARAKGSSTACSVSCQPRSN